MNCYWILKTHPWILPFINFNCSALPLTPQNTSSILSLTSFSLSSSFSSLVYTNHQTLLLIAIKTLQARDFPAVQWDTGRLCGSNAGSVSSISGQGTKISPGAQCGPKKFFKSETLHTAKFNLKRGKRTAILWEDVISSEVSIKDITFVSNRIEYITMIYILLLLLLFKGTTHCLC